MYDNLKSLGITNPEEIDRYSLRQEANNDILKIYFQKDKGEFFAKSVKFKYPRQRKTVSAVAAAMGGRDATVNLGISMVPALIKSASVTAAKLILSVRSSTTYVTWSQS